MPVAHVGACQASIFSYLYRLEYIAGSHSDYSRKKLPFGVSPPMRKRATAGKKSPLRP